MDYIAQLNAVAKNTSIENLSPNAFAVYMRLFWLNNELHWREWFSTTYARLSIETGIKSLNTIKTSVNALKQRGFIDVQYGKSKQANKYKIIPLYSVYVSNFDIKTEHKQNINRINPAIKTEHKQNENGTNPANIIKQDNTTQHQTDSGALSSSFKFSECVRFFDDNFHAITPMEFEKLGSLAEDYGQKRVLRALNIAVEQNKRSLAYVRGILERWEREGFPAVDERGKSAPVEKPKTPLPLPPFSADPLKDPYAVIDELIWPSDRMDEYPQERKDREKEHDRRMGIAMAEIARREAEAKKARA